MQTNVKYILSTKLRFGLKMYFPGIISAYRTVSIWQLTETPANPNPSVTSSRASQYTVWEENLEDLKKKKTVCKSQLCVPVVDQVGAWGRAKMAWLEGAIYETSSLDVF